MPFTFSHPALILPVTYLPKKYYSLTGLIMGSMTPDFEYFIRMRDFARYSHSIPGMFWYDMPLGLLLMFLFHNVVRNTLIEHMPFSLNIRFSNFEKFNWNQYFKKNTAVVLISLLVGIASHLFLDSFTHDGEYFADSIPLLSGQYYILNHQISGAAICQYGLSLVGGIVMIIYAFSFPEGRNTKQDNILNFWILVLLIAFIVLTIRLYLDSVLKQHAHEDVIVTTISGMLIGITSVCFFLKENNKRVLYKRLNKLRQEGRSGK